MKSYQTYMCRRKALGITQEEMANRVGCTVDDIRKYENGGWTPDALVQRIKNECYAGFKTIDENEHYLLRILEIALELQIEDNTDHALKAIGHMMVELGHLQMNLVDPNNRRAGHF